MILCPRTGRKPWKCMCPEHVAQRTAVGPDVSPTPNRDVGWAPARAVILSDRPVRIESVVTRGLYFFSRWRRAPDGDILWGPDGQPQREGGPGDGGLQCCVPEQSRSLLRGAMHVASVKPPTVVQLFRTENSEYFALRTYDGEYTFSRDTLDRALREMHAQSAGGAVGDPGDGDLIFDWVVGDRDVHAAARRLLNVGIGLPSILKMTEDRQYFSLHADGRDYRLTRSELDAAMARRAAEPGLHGSPRCVLDAITFRPQPGPQAAFMLGEHQDKRTFDLGEWARNGEWGTPMPPADLVFRPETDPHLVARARRLMMMRRHMCGHPNFGEGTPLILFYCSVDDRYLIRVPLEQLQEPHDVVVGHDELVDYTVPTDATPIERLSTRVCIHMLLKKHTTTEIPFAELRAWSEVGVDSVFCAWGAGVATLNGQAVAELGLQKTGRSPTMESPE